MIENLHQAIQVFVLERGRAPTRDEIYAMADFSQPGGIGRLLEALVIVGKGFEAARRRV